MGIVPLAANMAGEKYGKLAEPPPGTWSLSQWLPSVRISKPRKPRPSPASCGFEDERPGRVAEEDGPVPVRSAPREAFGRSRGARLAEENRPVGVAPGEEGRMALGSHEQDPPGRARADECVGDLQAGEEPRALHPDVERVRRREAELRCEQPAVSREVVRGRHRREDDEVDVRRGQAGVLQGVAGRRGSELDGGSPLAGEAALADPGALGDPLVARVHEPREPLVGHHTVGQVHAGAADDGGAGRHEGGTMSSGCRFPVLRVLIQRRG